MDQLLASLLNKQQQQMENQQKLMEELVKLSASTSASAVQPCSSTDSLMDMLSKNVKEFCYNPDSNQTFEAWYSRYEHLFGEDADKLEDAEKVRLVLRKLDPEIFDKYADYLLPRKPKELVFTETISTLKSLFGRKESLFSARVTCLQFIKSAEMDYITYGAFVNRNCDNFEFGKLKENTFKCLIFLRGLQTPEDAEIKARLLNILDSDKDELCTIDKMVSEVRRIQSLKHDATVADQNVHAVKSNQHKFREENSNIQEKPRRPCWQCGAMHFVKNCEYTNHRCEDCGVVGHKEGYCPVNHQYKTDNSQRGKTKFNKKQYHKKPQLNTINTIAANRKHIMVRIKNIQQRLLFDTGADISIISETVWKKIGKPELQPPEQTARDASGNLLNIIGQCKTEVEFQEKVISATLFVTQHNHLNIMGTDLMEQLEIWNLPIQSICNNIHVSELNTIEQKFPKLFSQQPGHCSTFQINLKLKSGVTPVFRPKRPVAYAALQQVDDELKRLEEANIIKPVSYSRWASPIVVVKKPNGKVRICGDYSTGVNECMETHTYPLPLPDDIFVNFNKCTYFTSIDMTDAYMQFEVDDATKEVLCINTHRGLYHFNRMAPGVKSAPGSFQQAMDTILSGVQFAFPYLDDVIIATPSFEENKKAVYEVFCRFEKHGLTLNINKCNFFSRSCTYLGYRVDEKGIHADTNKISAILEMPAPTNISELRSFLGAVNYYGKFIRKMRELRAPLDNLLKQDAEWKWCKSCEDSFCKFKDILASDLMLTHYNPSLPIKVAADASSVGIGGYICHIFPDGSEKAIYHVSRALTPAERNYSQIEKEGLGLVYAVTKFHKMLYGRHFKLETDHKPLLAIFGSKKGIAAHTASRLQRWSLTLMSYDFELSYVPTNQFGCADILSRLINTKQKPEEDVVIACAELEATVKSIIIDNINSFPITYNMVRIASQRDNTIQNITKYISSSWPRNPNAEEMAYFQRKDCLSTKDSCLLYQNRLVIPSSLRCRVLKQIHKGHQGIVRCKALARSYIYWPNLDKDVENMVKSCSACALASKSPPKAALQSWPLTQRPMERLHIDFAGPVNGYTYLLIIDAYSKYPEVYQLKSITTQTTISYLQDYFSKFGIPENLVSDNGTQFTSQHFGNFCSMNGINHIRTAPFHPQSNGQVERFVDTFKRALKKQETNSQMDGIREFLLYYRATPHQSCENRSPSELFLGRKIRVCMDLLLKPNPTEPTMRNSNMETQFNRHFNAQDRQFNVGDKVYAKVYKMNKFYWTPGVIKKRLGNVNYDVLLTIYPSFKTIKSHANQLKKRYVEDSSSPWLDMYDIDPAALISNGNECDSSTDNSEELQQPINIPLTSESSEDHGQSNLSSSTEPGSSLSSEYIVPDDDNMHRQSSSNPVNRSPEHIRRSARTRSKPNWFRDFAS